MASLAAPGSAPLPRGRAPRRRLLPFGAMKKATFRDTFECSVDRFWEVFFSDEYNRRLYGEALGFSDYQLLRDEPLPGGGRIKEVRQVPKADIPGFLKKLVGDGVSYVERGRFDGATRHWNFTVETSAMADKVKIGGDFWCEPRGENRCERISEMTFEVKVFGIGGKVEEFIAEQTADSYRKTAAFMARYLKEKGLEGT